MKIQNLGSSFSILVAVVAAAGIASPALAGEPVDAAATGFYGGLSLRDRGQDSQGLSIGPNVAGWTRYVAPTADDTAPRTLVFGGYRWSNDIAVEAAFNTIDKYALRPAGSVGSKGVGLSMTPGGGFGEPQNRTWNLDVFTSWTFYRSLALYGRLGYAQTDALPLSGPPTSVLDPRRSRDGVNYGLGLRYDMNSSLGLRLEYGRFGRFAGEVGSGFLPESDQVTFGVQFRF